MFKVGERGFCLSKWDKGYEGDKPSQFQWFTVVEELHESEETGEPVYTVDFDNGESEAWMRPSEISKGDIRLLL